MPPSLAEFGAKAGAPKWREPLESICVAAGLLSFVGQAGGRTDGHCRRRRTNFVSRPTRASQPASIWASWRCRARANNVNNGTQRFKWLLLPLLGALWRRRATADWRQALTGRPRATNEVARRPSRENAANHNETGTQTGLAAPILSSWRARIARTQSGETESTSGR
jgi:hypothetical protein